MKTKSKPLCSVCGAEFVLLSGDVDGCAVHGIRAARKIQVKSIMIQRAEGLLGHGVWGPLEVQSFYEADGVLRRMARTAPADGTYDKTDFCVTWQDGETYRGRYDLQRHDEHTADLRGHILEFARFHAGLWRPQHVSAQEYRDLLAGFLGKTVDLWKDFLVRYEV